MVFITVTHSGLLSYVSPLLHPDIGPDQLFLVVLTEAVCRLFIVPL